MIYDISVIIILPYFLKNLFYYLLKETLVENLFTYLEV